jgi:hypothetical protein
MSSDVVVKMERLDEPNLDVKPVLTPVSVKSEIRETVQAGSSTSRRRVSTFQVDGLGLMRSVG